jgi:hypothetical protein
MLTKIELELTFFGSFLHSKQVPNALFLLTDIVDNDSWELRRALRTHDVDTIILASNGGSVAEGLRMAGIIFDKQLTAYVPDAQSAIGCYSACAFMFFAGKNKLSEGQLGVHQVGYYGDNAAGNVNRKQGETLEQAQYTTSEIIGFLNEFETPPWVYERMFRSKEMYVFTVDEKIDLSTGEVPEITKTKVRKFLNDFAKYVEALNDKQDQEPNFVAFDNKDQERVKLFRTALNEAKCAAGVADGVWGRKTNSAALRFATTNGLPYKDHKSIDQSYIEKLVSETLVTCPPLPKPKKKTNLSGSWAFDLSCRNGTVKGWAKITFNYKRGNTDWYRVKYTNNLKQNFQGFATNNNGRLIYSLNQINGPSHSKGEGRVSANMRTLQCLSEAGCAFQARRT